MDPNAVVEGGESKEVEEKKESIQQVAPVSTDEKPRESPDEQSDIKKPEIQEETPIIEMIEDKICREECKCLDFSIGDFVVENVGLKNDFYFKLKFRID